MEASNVSRNNHLQYYMTARKLITAGALALMFAAGTAAAQTTTYTPTDTTGAATTSTTPGTPNTGAGGDATANEMALATSALIAAGGAAYLLKRQMI